MSTSLYEDILKKFRLMSEQGIPPPPPPPAGGGDLGVGGAGAPPGGPPGADAGGGADGGEEESEEEKDLEDMVEIGQPPVSENDPIGAIYDYGMGLGKKTIDPLTVMKGVRSAIQANFKYLDNDIRNAWPVVERFQNTENQLMMDVAQRLSLFISGTIQENHKRANMKVSKEEIRSLVREALKARSSKKTVKEVSITPMQLENVIKKVVTKVVAEGTLFDTYRTQIDQEQSAIEQQLTSADIRRMAIDLFEKICDKTGVDSDSLTPEAMEFVKSELDRMVTSAQEIANKLIQVATVVKTASGGASKAESEEEQG